VEGLVLVGDVGEGHVLGGHGGGGGVTRRPPRGQQVPLTPARPRRVVGIGVLLARGLVMTLTFTDHLDLAVRLVWAYKETSDTIYISFCPYLPSALSFSPSLYSFEIQAR
jgi:hypothetical protein